MMRVMQNNLPITKKNLDSLEQNLDQKIDAVEKRLNIKIKGLATKEELAKLDAKIEQTENILRTEIRLTAEETKEEIREEIKQSSSKILNVLDSFLGEIKTSQEERTISAHQLRNQEERIGVLEQTAGIATL